MLPVLLRSRAAADPVVEARLLLREQITGWRSQGKTWAWIKQQPVWRAYLLLGGG